MAFGYSAHNVNIKAGVWVRVRKDGSMEIRYVNHRVKRMWRRRVREDSTVWGLFAKGSSYDTALALMVDDRNKATGGAVFSHWQHVADAQDEMEYWGLLEPRLEIPYDMRNARSVRDLDHATPDEPNGIDIFHTWEPDRAGGFICGDALPEYDAPADFYDSDEYDVSQAFEGIAPDDPSYVRENPLGHAYTSGELEDMSGGPYREETVEMPSCMIDKIVAHEDTAAAPSPTAAPEPARAKAAAPTPKKTATPAREPKAATPKAKATPKATPTAAKPKATPKPAKAPAKTADPSPKTVTIVTAPGMTPARDIPALAGYARKQWRHMRDSHGRKCAYVAHDGTRCVVVFRDWYHRDDAELEAALTAYVRRLGWVMAA